MADKRYFAKIDVGYFDNPKIADALDDHPAVVLLHLRAILYCRQHLTNGMFPIRQVARLVGATWCGEQCSEECSMHCAEHSGEQCTCMCDVHLSMHAGLLEWVATPNRAYVHDYLKHQESAETAEERKAKARKASEARWGRDRQPSRTSKDAPSNAPSNASSIPPSNASRNAEERRGEERRSSSANALQGEPSEAFEKFWATYPRKVGKGAAQKAWAKATKTTPPNQILTSLTEQLPTLHMQKRPDGDYRPHPATWLNEKRWEDDPEPPTTATDTRAIPNEHWDNGGTFFDNWRNQQ